MKTKLFAVLIALSITLPVNATICSASDNNPIVQEVSALNSQSEFCTKMTDLLIPFPKKKVDDMRQRYNLQYLGILTRHGVAVDGIQIDLDMIWQRIVKDNARRTAWILMLVAPYTLCDMDWREYKSKVLDLTKLRFSSAKEAT